MVLGFKKQFKPLILAGVKKHTIRKDEHNRWTTGRIIHFAIGVRTKHYEQFYEDVCVSIQLIEVKYCTDVAINPHVIVTVDGVRLQESEVLLLAKNDGFSSLKEFFEWFNKDFSGKIIHWTDLTY